MTTSTGATPPVAMTIAGSDSGGGAGLQADLRAFAALGTFGTSIVTAVTAQNTAAVTDVHVLPVASIAAQLDAVLSDLPVAAVKTGMLATTEVVAFVAEQAGRGRLPNLVVDPVLVSASGHRLLEDEAVATYRNQLLPHAAVLTPNLVEAGVLLGREVVDLDDARAAAEELVAMGPAVVVVKGGHGTGEDSVDVVASADGLEELTNPRVPTGNDHGTGCTFAAATAAGLALGLPVHAALQRAKAYVTAAIVGSAGWQLGAGHGPLDHLGVGSTGRPPFGAEGWAPR